VDATLKHTPYISGGAYNLANDLYTSITGGCNNLAGTIEASTATCETSGLESILGGEHESLSTTYDSQAGSTVFTP
jgi:hypothetical protein